ncbi:PREDICTED: activating signal cointegrator 1 complex subunit 1-like [Priapulus caudatus]|uniref:Activating signal cointegrator 1 complex subunit 1-like n=1 Tax=Priapulus caudatus TaxID=37621 RepID=A0ABM1DS61_PRICU|nr:PREDICTED: activating signal cointegrator 1 complex subunit 1-like [Priapulus caudatus]
MDVLRPRLMWIEGRCYRVNVVDDSVSGSYRWDEEETSGWVTKDEEARGSDDADIEQTDTGYRTCLEVPSPYFKYLIGKKGETKKRLESETKTRITIPKSGEEGEILIVGAELHGVRSARTRIELLLLSVRMRQPFTHFISIPVARQHIKEALFGFRDEVLRRCDGDRGVNFSLFQDADKLHVTVSTLVLLSEAERQCAAHTLQQCCRQLADDAKHPLAVTLRGVEYMNDDPSAVDVLYARVEDASGRLQSLADGLVSSFADAGLTQRQREHEHVKLHVTVMNTIFRRDAEAEVTEGNARESFDARRLMQEFVDYEFGELVITELHISQRYTTASDGYYEATAVVPLSV